MRYLAFFFLLFLLQCKKDAAPVPHGECGDPAINVRLKTVWSSSAAAASYSINLSPIVVGNTVLAFTRVSETLSNLYGFNAATGAKIFAVSGKGEIRAVGNNKAYSVDDKEIWQTDITTGQTQELASFTRPIVQNLALGNNEIIFVDTLTIKDSITIGLRSLSLANGSISTLFQQKAARKSVYFSGNFHLYPRLIKGSSPDGSPIVMLKCPTSGYGYRVWGKNLKNGQVFDKIMQESNVTPFSFSNTVYLDKGKVFILNAGFLFAYDFATGQELWKTNIKTLGAGFTLYQMDDYFFFEISTPNNSTSVIWELYEKANGKLMWNRTGNLSRIYTSNDVFDHFVKNGRLFFNANSSFTGIRLDNGCTTHSQRSNAPGSGSISSGPVISADGKVVFVYSGENVMGVEAPE